jgi:8-oxo-dGTP pyrophosphatase MutT (NUDIX family)
MLERSNFSTLNLTLKQRLTDPAIDGLWLREELMPRFVDGGAARPVAPPPGAPAPRPGAVLVLLYPHNDAVSLPLTVRTAALRNHSGEVSLPGGRYDESDGDLQQTALREAWEELAIPPDTVEVWTTLTPVWIPVSNFQITPFVGWSDARPHFNPSADEVAELIEAPLDTLLRPDIIHTEEWERREQRMHVPFFTLGQHKVWGATSMILAELVGKLRNRR